MSKETEDLLKLWQTDKLAAIKKAQPDLKLEPETEPEPELTEIEHLRTRLETLEEGLKELRQTVSEDMSQIMRALDRLDAPPSTEEAPAMTKLEKRVKILEDDLDKVWGKVFPKSALGQGK